MDKMNDLLEKYFRAETTISEENKLKHYFMSDKVMAEHEMYRPLFETFEMELHETADLPLKKVLSVQRGFKRTWIQNFAYSGIAAAIVLALWIQCPRQDESYAIIHGQRIDNPEYAQKYAEKKLNDVNERLQHSLKPLRDLEVLKENLRNASENGSIKDDIIESNKNSNINN